MGLQAAFGAALLTASVSVLLLTLIPPCALASHGNFSDFPFIYLTHPPEIIRKPSNQGVRVGGVATFFCGARGDPQPNIVWRKNGKKIMGKYL
nr:tyrosine-protein phosphatase Lar-like [Aedes albopictus]XP_029724847.1 tyrosine-protein phosphatase Lar-like [Aedes albopictus]